MTTTAPSVTLHYVDDAAKAVDHLLDSDFGARLRELATVSVFVQRSSTSDYDSARAEVTYNPETIRFQLSTGERILLKFLESMAFSFGTDFAICELGNLDDDTWDRVIATLFILRGRGYEAAS